MTGWLDRLAAHVHGGWSWGPETPAFLNRYGVSLWASPNQLMLNARWDWCGAQRNVELGIGPFGALVTVARRELIADPPMPPDRMRRWALGRWDVSGWVDFRHAGVSLEGSRSLRFARVRLGPLGAALEERR